MEYEYIRTPKVDANCTKEQFVHELDKIVREYTGGKQRTYL